VKIYLLTHERERHKKSNTGRLVKACLKEQVEIIVWKRKEPDERLIKLLESGELAMLYPDEASSASALISGSVSYSADDFEQFLIVDSTWQEARKIYNKSPYLKIAKKVSLSVDSPSEYRLRKNQIEGGLSTVECAIALLGAKGEHEMAKQLKNEFDHMNAK